eukprot:699077-Pleurochrysis_carterae.AAC.3
MFELKKASKHPAVRTVDAMIERSCTLSPSVVLDTVMARQLRCYQAQWTSSSIQTSLRAALVTPMKDMHECD